MSLSDDNDATSRKPKAGPICRKAKKTAVHKKPVAPDTIISCIASKGLSVENGSKT